MTSRQLLLATVWPWSRRACDHDAPRGSPIGGSHSAESEIGFEDAIKVGIARAAQTVRGIKSAWVKEQSVKVSDGSVTSYRVDMLVTFLLEG